MTCCLVSHRPFPDGPVQEPIWESDPVNMAWVLSGHYLSFFTVRRLSDAALRRRLAPFNPIIVTLAREDLDTVERVCRAASGQVFTYSEGHIWDYQTLPPAAQRCWVELLRRAHLNLLYWRRYLPFYRLLSPVPAAYLPYPFLADQAASLKIPPADRPRLGMVPTGLAGQTRNGLADVTVVRALRAGKVLSRWTFCLDSDTFAEDAESILALLLQPGEERPQPPSPGRWTAWLARSGWDYRPLLRLRDRLRRRLSALPAESAPVWWAGPDLAFLRRTGWRAYLEHLAQARLMVDLNNRETVGRNALDCAALGVPCVSTSRSDLQPRLFPETTVSHPWAVDEAVALCRRLLQDEGFYRRVCEEAAARLPDFGPEAFRQRFAQAANRALACQTQT